MPSLSNQADAVLALADEQISRGFRFEGMLNYHTAAIFYRVLMSMIPSLAAAVKQVCVNMYSKFMDVYLYRFLCMFIFLCLCINILIYLISFESYFVFISLLTCMHSYIAVSIYFQQDSVLLTHTAQLRQGMYYDMTSMSIVMRLCVHV